MLADGLWEHIFDIPQLPIIMGCLIPIVGIIGKVWYKTQKVRVESELKQSMVERGMSVDEIERVIAARPKGQDE